MSCGEDTTPPRSASRTGATTPPRPHARGRAAWPSTTRAAARGRGRGRVSFPPACSPAAAPRRRTTELWADASRLDLIKEVLNVTPGHIAGEENQMSGTDPLRLRGRNRERRAPLMPVRRNCEKPRQAAVREWVAHRNERLVVGINPDSPDPRSGGERKLLPRPIHSYLLFLSWPWSDIREVERMVVARYSAIPVA